MLEPVVIEINFEEQKKNAPLRHSLLYISTELHNIKEQ